MFPQRGVALIGWRAALVRTAAAVRLLLCTGALLAVTSAASGSGGGSYTVWAAEGRAPANAWTVAIAQRYPDCDPGLRMPVPASVIEVRASGIPVRVGFGDAWQRAHDGVAGNSGRILAQCRQGVPGRH